MNNILPFPTTLATTRSDQEAVQNALKYRMTLVMLRRMLDKGDITQREHDIGQAMMARRFCQTAVCEIK